MQVVHKCDKYTIAMDFDMCGLDRRPGTGGATFRRKQLQGHSVEDPLADSSMLNPRRRRLTAQSASCVKCKGLC